MAGTAQPRSASVTAVSGPFDLVDAPDGQMPGDVILAFIQVAGLLDDVDIHGGAPWTILDEFDDNEDSGLRVRVYGTVVGTTYPSSYAVELGDDAEGTVGLMHLRGATLADILLVSDSGGLLSDTGIPCPAASPGVAGGVEVRYCVGFTDSGLGASSTFPVEDEGEGAGSAAYVGARTSLSSSGLPGRTIGGGFGLIVGWQAWTVIVAPGDYVPPPPPRPAYAVQGRALYRYTAHDLLTGGYIDDLYPRDPVYSKRLIEPGTFTGSLPIPNPRVARAVRRVIPLLKSDLSTGPGRVEIRVWRDGDLWGRYWLTGARLSRGRDGRIAIELRASTLDALWYSLRVAVTLDGSDDEQIDNARAVLSHGLTQAGADIGITFQSGDSGVFRPLYVESKQNTSYGRAVQEYAKNANGFEYFLAETVTDEGVVSTWMWGSPKITSSVRHVFSTSPHGGDIADYSIDMDALRGGTDWVVRGGTPETEAQEDSFPLMSELVTTPHRAAGWPRIDHLIDHPTQSLVQDELDDLAAYYAEVAGGALWVRTVSVLLGKRPTLNMNSLGDSARMLITDVWFERVDGGAGLDISERIIGIEVRPTGRGRGREEVVLTLEAVEVP